MVDVVRLLLVVSIVFAFALPLSDSFSTLVKLRPDIRRDDDDPLLPPLVAKFSLVSSLPGTGMFPFRLSFNFFRLGEKSARLALFFLLDDDLVGVEVDADEAVSVSSE